MTFSLIFFHTDPVWVSQTPRSDTGGVRIFPCGDRSPPPRPQPFCRALPERGCHSPRAKDRELRWTVLGAALDLRGCGPWSQGWAKVGSTRTIGSPESRQAGRGAPRGNQRRRCEAGTSRGALSGGGGHWRNAALAAGCRRSALSLPAPRRCAAEHPALGRRGPGASENAERGCLRGIQAAQRTHVNPGSAGKGEVGARFPAARQAGERAASWAGLAPRAASRAELGAGYLLDEVHPGAAQVLKRSSVISCAPPPILCLFFFLN